MAEIIINVICYSFIFVLGLVIGSFLNVCIYRIPKGESIVLPRSHCMHCGNVLPWYDLIPLFSYLYLGGKCRKCKEAISIQYPIIELTNAVGYVWIFCIKGYCIDAVIDSLAFSILVVLSMIDVRTYSIPFQLNICLGVLGFVNMIVDRQNWFCYLIGVVCVSGGLLVLYLVTKGRGIGGGDIKLMAAAGLLLGWKNVILAFFIGCILASVIHLTLMKTKKKGHQLAFGPYLSAGIVTAILYGDQILTWYISKM